MTTQNDRISASNFVLSLLIKLGVELPSAPPSPSPDPASKKNLSDEQVYAILARIVENATSILWVIKEAGHVPEILVDYFTKFHNYHIVLPGKTSFDGPLSRFLAHHSLCEKRLRKELDKSRVFKIVKTNKGDEFVVPYDTPVPDTGYTPYYMVDPWIFVRMLDGEKIPYRYIWQTFNGSNNKEGEWWQRKEHHLILKDPRFKTYCEKGIRRFVYVYFRMPSMDLKKSCCLSS